MRLARQIDRLAGEGHARQVGLGRDRSRPHAGVGRPDRQAAPLHTCDIDVEPGLGPRRV